MIQAKRYPGVERWGNFYHKSHNSNFVPVVVYIRDDNLIVYSDTALSLFSADVVQYISYISTRSRLRSYSRHARLNEPPACVGTMLRKPSCFRAGLTKKLIMLQSVILLVACGALLHIVWNI